MGPWATDRAEPLSELAAQSPFQRLLDRRIVFLRGALSDDGVDVLAAQLLALDADGAEPITLYIDSPGRDRSDAPPMPRPAGGMFALYDTIQLLAAPVDTRCVGLAASEAAFVLATGTGTRSATPNARVLLQQPFGQGAGRAADLQVLADQFDEMRVRTERILAERTGKPVEQIHRDMQRDFWLSADEALAYGLIDEVVSSARPLSHPPSRC